MKRRLSILLILAGLFFAGAQDGSAFSLMTDGAVPSAGYILTDTADDDDRGRKLLNQERYLEDRKERKGIGAGFWGGPYWGYGPRWGHPCQSCRASCDEEQEGARCQRCRMRCGW